MNRVSSFVCYLLGIPYADSPWQMSWSKKCFKRKRAGSPAVLLCVEWFPKFVPTWRRGSHERRKWLEVKVPERSHNRHRLRSHLTNFLTEKPAIPFARQSSITNATNSAKNNVALACLIMPMPSALSNCEKSNTKCHTDWRHASLGSQPLCVCNIFAKATCQSFWTQWMNQVLMWPPVQIKSCLFAKCHATGFTKQCLQKVLQQAFVISEIIRNSLP